MLFLLVGQRLVSNSGVCLLHLQLYFSFYFARKRAMMLYLLYNVLCILPIIIAH